MTACLHMIESRPEEKRPKTLRPHAIRGDGRNESRQPGIRTRPYQDGTIRTDRRSMMENTLDGNAAAGMLQAIFPFDMTLVQATCAGCGTTNAIGATVAYIHGMGTVVR